MKNVLRYCLGLVMFASAWACQDDLIPETDGQQGGITLVFSSSSLATKAPGDGVESLNENKIQTVHYFLFPEDPDDLQTDNRDRQPSHWGVLTNLEAQNAKKITLNISDDDLNNVVFPRPYDECEVYAIVNLPKSIVIDEDTDKTLSNLKSIALDADFVSKATQDLFVMEGIGVAQLDSRTSVKAAEGEIAVDRVAAKLSVNIDVEDEVTYDEKTWRSLPEEMTVTFHNGVSNAVLSGDPAMVTPAYFTQAPQRSFAQSGALWVCEPFYSYPVNWTVGAEEEPYLKIVLPWINEDTGASASCLYHTVFVGSTFQCSGGSGPYGNDAASFSLGLVDDVSSFLAHRIFFKVHLMLFHNFTLYRTESPDPYMQSYKGQFDTLRLGLLQNFLCEVKPCGGSSYRTFFTAIHRLVTVLILKLGFTFDVRR